MRSLTIALAICAICVSNSNAQEKIYSGPQPGEEIKSFNVVQVNSPEEVVNVEIGESDGPTMLCFMHKVSEPAIGLMMTLEYYAGKQEGLHDHYIMLTDDRAKTEQQLKRWAQRSFLRNSPFSLSPDGPEGPGHFGLNRNVTATVIVAKDNKVIKSFALQDPNASDSGPILAAVGEALGKPAPTYEEIRTAMQSERQKRRQMQMRENPIVKLAPNEQLGMIMLRMLRTERDREENAKEKKAQLLEYAGENKEKMAAVRMYCKAILEGDFEMDQFSRKVLQELSKEK